MTRAVRVVLIVIAAGAALVLGTCAVGVYAFLSVEDAGPPTTNTDSSSLPDDAARVAFAAQYMTFHSKVDVAAFHIVFHNNGFAPSDSSIDLAIKTAAADVGLWTRGLQPTTPVTRGICPQLMGRDARLHAASTPTFYGGDQCWRAVYATEGVICVSCHPL